MTFTILYAVLAFFALMLVFGFTYKIKGLKIAILSTGAAFVVSAVLLIVMIYAITAGM